MKYWYVKFEYYNETRGEAFECDRVIISLKEHFPLKEVKEMAIKELKNISELDKKTDLVNDDFSIMISNQVQINQEDFDAFNKEFKKNK